jgi:membrane protein YdbS with pleckstrin-like domain
MNGAVRVAGAGGGYDAPVEYLRPSPRMWLARQAVMALLGVVLVLLALAIALTAPATAIWLLVVTPAFLALMWSVEFGRYRSWGYCEREDDLLVRRGLLVRRLSVVPYGRMQFIDVTAGPVDRLFGIAAVQLHTAAAASDARIPGLLRVDADRLRDRLAALGEARASGL